MLILFFTENIKMEKFIVFEMYYGHVTISQLINVSCQHHRPPSTLFVKYRLLYVMTDNDKAKNS